MYAIANALMECGAEDGEEISGIVCSVFARRRWPEVLWEGTSFDDMKTMIRACLREQDISDIRPRYPFRQSEPKNNNDYWTKSDRIFKSDTTVCGIVCVKFLASPILHWIVAKNDGSRVVFLDSDANYLASGKTEARFMPV